MDAQIKRRLVNPVKIYPFIKFTMGDKMFGEPIETKGYVIPKIGDVTGETGEEYQFKNKVILENLTTHNISESDEIELEFIGRLPIKTVARYNSLRPGCELIEVYC